MPRDYKNSGRTSRSNNKQAIPLPCWVWGLAGLAVGLLVALIVSMQDQAPAHTPTPALAPQAPPAEMTAKPVQQPPAVPAQPQRPHFEFYTLLPELEVVVPETAPPKPPAASQPPATATPQPPATTSAPTESPSKATPPPAPASERFMLQAGSFRQNQEAERLRASLALLGVEARIQQVTVNNDTWYRVHVGPFSSRSEADRVRERLTNNQVQTMLLRLPGSG